MDNYQDKIEKYRKNEMTQAEADNFEKELADISALFDYLIENDVISEFSTEIESDDFYKSEKNVKKKVRKRIFHLAISISLIVLLIIGSCFFLIPKVIDSMNYNPLQGQVVSKDGLKRVEEPSGFELFNRIENLIFPEGDRLVGILIDHIGAGKYSIQTEYYNDFRGVRSVSQAVMDRGSIISGLSDSTNNYSLIYGNKNDFETDETISDDSVLNSKIALLPESSWVKVNLTFADPKNWSELQDFIQQNEEVVFHSAIVNTGVSTLSEMGIRFNLESNDNLSSLTMLPVPYSNEFVTRIEKDYPYLLSQVTTSSTEDQVKSYLLSNIEYLIDHMDDDLYKTTALPGKEESESKEDQLSSIKQKLENEDLLFYKIQVSLPKQVFKDFVNENEFFYATLEDLSLFN